MSASHFHNFETGALDTHDWSTLIADAEPGNIWQNPVYGAARWGHNRIECRRLVAGSSVVATAMVALSRIPFYRPGLAYVQFGPVLQQRQEPGSSSILQEFLQQLRRHYVVERGMILWVRPREGNAAGRLTKVFSKAGFVSQPYRSGRGTYRVDLGKNITDIRATLSKSWRRNLKKAEAQSFDFSVEKDTLGFSRFAELHDELMVRKSFKVTPELRAIAEISTSQPELARLQTYVCSYAGQPLAAVLVSALGDTGTALMSVTSSQARELRAGYALDWWCASRLRAKGYRWYDLGGDQTPGVNEYKAGLAGRQGHVEFAGPFVAGGNSLLRHSLFGLRALRRGLGRHA